MKVYFYIFLVVVLAACSSGTANPEDEANAESNPQSAAIIQVETATVQMAALQQEISASGKLEALQSALVSFKSAGNIQQILVKNGQRLQQGQLMAVLDPQLAQLAVLKANNHLKEREIEYRNQLMGFTAGLQGESKSQIIETLRYNSGLAAAEIALEEAEIALANTRLIAPFRGVVADCDHRVGNAVSAQERFALLYQPDRLLINSAVLETEMAKLQLGQKAIVSSLANPEQEFEARLSQINPLVDENGLVKIQLEVINAKVLVPGMNVHLVIQIPNPKQLLIPKQALVMRSGKKVVFTEQNGLAKWNYIETGQENSSYLEVVDGLKEGMNVIISNNQQLAHDSPVQLATLRDN